MKYTNKNNLPPIVEQWLKNDEYDYKPGVMSATGLMKPIRATILTERHYAELEMDISDLIALRYGTAIHTSFEQVKYGPEVEQERRVTISKGDVQISGKFDMLVKAQDNTFTLYDIKSTSVWNFIFDNKTQDYITQLSIYRYLLTREGKTVNGVANIIMVFTDWSKKKAKEDPTYPQIRMVVKQIDLWDIATTEQWITDRLSAIAKARELDDNKLPECTDDELWKKKDSFAVKKVGGVKAIKVYDNKDEAEKGLGPGQEIETRKGMVSRCPDYCPCHPFCNQFKQLKEQGYINEGGE